LRKGQFLTHEIPHILWNQKTHCHIHNSLPLVPNPRQKNLVHTLPFYFFKIQFNILPSMPASSKLPLSFRFPTKTLYAFILYSKYVTSLIDFTLLNLMSLIIFGKKYDSRCSSLCNYLQSALTSCLFSKIPSSAHHFSNTLSPRCSLNRRNQVLHPYETTGKIILRIYSVQNRKIKDSGPNGGRQSLILCCS
jgi:hypothetical protein